MKRLFLFAAYDKNGVIDESLIIYVRALSKLGDVVFVMDSDADVSAVKPYTIFARAERHGEYDFGSYKRAYEWAATNLRSSISDYDFVYMVNDSVYLLGDITLPECLPTDAFGMVLKKHKKFPHLQSWFIGMRPRVFLSDQFDDFMRGITGLPDKSLIAVMYEIGFTKMISDNGGTYDALYTVHGHGVYNKIKSLFRRGLPFMKKAAFVRRHGALGRQVLYVLRHIDKKYRDAIIENACRVYDISFLTNNPIKIFWRNVKHILSKTGIIK